MMKSALFAGVGVLALSIGGVGRGVRAQTSATRSHDIRYAVHITPKASTGALAVASGGPAAPVPALSAAARLSPTPRVPVRLASPTPAVGAAWSKPPVWTTSGTARDVTLALAIPKRVYRRGEVVKVVLRLHNGERGPVILPATCGAVLTVQVAATNGSVVYPSPSPARAAQAPPCLGAPPLGVGAGQTFISSQTAILRGSRIRGIVVLSSLGGPSFQVITPYLTVPLR